MTRGWMLLLALLGVAGMAMACGPAEPDGEVDATARFGVCVGPRCEPVEHRFRIAGYVAGP